MRSIRSLALGAILVLASAPVAAQAGVVASPTTTGPAYYVLKSAKARCRAGYTKERVTVTARRHRKRVKLHQLRCERLGVSGGSVALGSSFHSVPSFALGLPQAEVTLSIIPTASAHTYATEAGQALSVGGSGVLADATGSGGLSAVLVSGPASGSLMLNRDGTLSYTPAPGASGVEDFTYKVVDALGESSTPASVTVDVSPLAADATYDTPANETLTIPAGGLLAADTGSGLQAALIGSTANGSLNVQPDGSATYTPDAGFSGVDTFTYQAVDADSLHSNTATVTIHVGAQPPTVTSETFSGAIANTELQVGGSGAGGPEVHLGGTSALAGDVDSNGGTLSVTPGTVPTSNGGSVTLASNGSFSYLPPAGFSGPSDTFSYTVNTSEGTSAVASATIDFSSGRVWYLDGASPTNGVGTSASPFNSAASATAAAAPGDVIFLLSDYNGPVALGPNVTLEGAGTSLVVSGETLLAASTAPAVTDGASSAVTLAEGDLVAGVAARGVVANGVDDFTIAASASISSPSGGDALDISAGSGTIGVGAPITSTSGHSVSITGRTGGTITLNGTVGDSGTGILVSGDGSSQITFNGAITAATGASPAFTATGGGVVTATSLTNSLSTTSGVALDVASGSTIGTQGMLFASLSAGDSTDHPASGMILDGTASGGGVVTISGGAIQDTTSAGVALTDTGPVSLTGMTISASGGDGIDAVNVTSLAVDHTQVVDGGSAGIAVSGTGSVSEQLASLAFDTLYGQPGTAITLDFGGSGEAALDHDTIGDGPAGSGSQSGDGIDLSDTSGTFIAELGQNTLGDIAAGTGISAQELSGSTLDLTIDGNAVTSSQDGVSIVGGTGDACVNPSANTLSSTAGGTYGLAVSQPSALGTFEIEGYGGAATDVAAVETFLESAPLSTLTAFASLGAGAGYTNGACPLPSLLDITS